MKLAHRLALLTAGVTAGTIATALVSAFLLVQHSARRELDEVVVDGAKAATVVVAQLEESPERGSTWRGLVLPDEVALMVQHVAVYTVDGKRIAARPEATDLPDDLRELSSQVGGRLNTPFDVELSGLPMRAVLVSSRALRGRTLVHAVSRSQLDEIIQSRARVFAGLFIGTLGLVLLAARWLGRRLAADVNRVTAVARRVASGELSARAGTTGLASPETRALAQELDNMVAELAALMASQRNFISYAAHELRSPLAAIQGELQLALRRPRTIDAYVETLGSVLSDVAALTQLAEDLLTLARAQANPSVIEQTHVAAVVEDAIHFVQGAAQIQDAKIDVEIDLVAKTRIVGLHSDLCRLLRNLLENAIKFGPSGGHVLVRGQRDADFVHLVVQDSGPGIDPKDQAGLFEPFFRGSTPISKSTNGTGLGLAIALEIARKAGGDISLDSSYSGGARFLVKLAISRLGLSES
jgi:two-component system heavy metal sensor histidine kinase CusS